MRALFIPQIIDDAELESRHERCRTPLQELSEEGAV